MILIYETLQTHASHAPFTRAFTQMVAHACPDQRIIVHARESHLRAAFGEADALLDRHLTQQVISENAGGWDLPRTLRLLHTTYGRSRRQRPLVIFLTSRPYHIWAAKLFKLCFAGFRCHLVLHGDINTIRQPRARNPFLRIADHFSSIAHANQADIRFLALETHIGANLAATIPAARDYIDVVHHPCVPGPAAWDSPVSVRGRLRFGLLGIAGRSKGLDVFARVASNVAPASVTGADFRLIGKVQPGWQDLDLSGISGPRPFSEDWLPRSLFEQELADLHYVILPYDMDYYALAASGVLLDALRWRKPIIAFNTPALHELTRCFGEIGHICKDEDEMLATVRGLVSGFDLNRYQAQRRNLDAAYLSRLPEAIAIEYARIVRSRWGSIPADAGVSFANTPTR